MNWVEIVVDKCRIRGREGQVRSHGFHDVDSHRVPPIGKDNIAA